MAKKAAIVLSGCGVKDGSEIHESVLAALCVVKSGGETLFFAPSGPQAQVVNHITGKQENEERNMLVEAARIARGKISDLKFLNSSAADVLIFPGGLGAALNLCDFGKRQAGCSVHPEVKRVIDDFHRSGKPIGFICIAPAIAARVLGPLGVELTIGNEPSTARELEVMGARHTACKVSEVHIDRRNKVVSTPAYMLAQNIAEVEGGISKLVTSLFELC